MASPSEPPVLDMSHVSMPQLLEVTTKLMHIQQHVHLKEFRLPRIAVVGSQSAGKSSVLEAIVRRDFLPRGDGIVTRVPLQLTLLHDETIPPNKEYAVFSHKPDQQFTDFTAVTREILAQTDVLAGHGHSVVNQPIELTIHSPSVVNLILIDLPGLTEVRLKDQPTDIVNTIKDLVASYISDPNTIILAVSPGNQDIATSRALDFAAQYDPSMSRTLGVITKVDLAPSETELRKLLLNEIKELKLGFVGLRLRSATEVQQNKSAEQMIADEAAFFQTNPHYMDFAKHCGTLYLEQRLSNMLLDKVQSFLPEFQHQLQNLQQQYQKKLAECGTSPDEQGPPPLILHQIITGYDTQYKLNMSGEISSIPGALEKVKDHRYGGALLNYRLFEWYGEELKKVNINWPEMYSQIVTQINNSAGIDTSMFPTDKTMKDYCKKSITLLERPSLQLLEKINYDCKQLLKEAANAVDGIVRFPALRDRVSREAQDFLESIYTDAQQHLRNHFEVLKSSINTRHPEFDAAQIKAEAAEAAKQVQSGLETLLLLLFFLIIPLIYLFSFILLNHYISLSISQYLSSLLSLSLVLSLRAPPTDS